MSKESSSKVVVIQPSDIALTSTDIVEKIISEIMQTGEITVVGINDSMSMVCSALNTATEIAKAYIDDIDIASFEMPVLGKVCAISAHLAQKQTEDYSQLAEKEEKAMPDQIEQTINVSRASTMERLITISLLRLAKFDEVKLAAAGGSINDAISLALKLTNGEISKEPVGIKLFHLYSILMRNDTSKSIAAISIYLQKGMATRYTKRQSEVFKKIAEVNNAPKS